MTVSLSPQHVVLTGDRPTGFLHLGHYVGSLATRLTIQGQCPQYVMIADLQSLTDHHDQGSVLSQRILDVMEDYAAVGLKSPETTFFLQSAIPELTELSFYYMNLVTLARLQRNPTIKQEIQQKNLEASLPAGFLCYPISQAADITCVQATHVPVGEDQLPLIEQTNEIVRRFHHLYGDTILQEVTPLLSTTPRLSGIHGQHKASKSLNNAIYLRDNRETLEQKVMSMYTDPNHIKISDPGCVDHHVVFEYLTAFHPHKDQVQAWKEHYQKGGLGDRFLKDTLIKTLEQFLAPQRERRHQYTPETLEEWLKEGTKKARHQAKHVLAQVKDALGLHFFK